MPAAQATITIISDDHDPDGPSDRPLLTRPESASAVNGAVQKSPRTCFAGWADLQVGDKARRSQRWSFRYLSVGNGILEILRPRRKKSKNAAVRQRLVLEERLLLVNLHKARTVPGSEGKREVRLSFYPRAASSSRRTEVFLRVAEPEFESAFVSNGLWLEALSAAKNEVRNRVDSIEFDEGATLVRPLELRAFAPSAADPLLGRGENLSSTSDSNADSCKASRLPHEEDSSGSAGRSTSSKMPTRRAKRPRASVLASCCFVGGGSSSLEVPAEAEDPPARLRSKESSSSSSSALTSRNSDATPTSRSRSPTFLSDVRSGAGQMKLSSSAPEQQGSFTTKLQLKAGHKIKLLDIAALNVNNRPASAMATSDLQLQNQTHSALARSPDSNGALLSDGCIAVLSGEFGVIGFVTRTALLESVSDASVVYHSAMLLLPASGSRRSKAVVQDPHDVAAVEKSTVSTQNVNAAADCSSSAYKDELEEATCINNSSRAGPKRYVQAPAVDRFISLADQSDDLLPVIAEDAEPEALNHSQKKPASVLDTYGPEPVLSEKDEKHDRYADDEEAGAGEDVSTASREENHSNSHSVSAPSCFEDPLLASPGLESASSSSSTCFLADGVVQHFSTLAQPPFADAVRLCSFRNTSSETITPPKQAEHVAGKSTSKLPIVLLSSSSTSSCVSTVRVAGPRGCATKAESPPPVFGSAMRQHGALFSPQHSTTLAVTPVSTKTTTKNLHEGPGNQQDSTPNEVSAEHQTPVIWPTPSEVAIDDFSGSSWPSLTPPSKLSEKPRLVPCTNADLLNSSGCSDVTWPQVTPAELFGEWPTEDPSARPEEQGTTDDIRKTPHRARPSCARTSSDSADNISWPSVSAPNTPAQPRLLCTRGTSPDLDFIRLALVSPNPFS
ncbi:unnamed protein product [Amoebophrya sp. A120]|nr:unnamed protein product [Amoebophrya sp. A120]|eukprot:GSA120T00004805001.1